MRSVKRVALVLAAMGALGWVRGTEAEVVKAASLSAGDVQAAINAAKDGDTVALPEGIGTWAVQVKMIGKGITLKGAGTGKTVIVDATPNVPSYGNKYGTVEAIDRKMLKIEGVEGKPWRMTGITFRGRPVGDDSDKLSGCPYLMCILGTSKNWRIDHCEFLDAYAGFWVRGNTHGLVDHCQFKTAKMELLGVGGMKRAVILGMWLEGDGDEGWERPVKLGTAEAVYVEDCDFTFGDIGGNQVAVHSENGSRMVIRHCTLNCVIESFTAYGSRGGVSFEIYDNVFGGAKMGAAFPTRLNHGTGVVFNNKLEGGVFSMNGLFLDCYRAWGNYGAPVPGTDGAAAIKSQCDGSNILDGNLPYDASAKGKHTGENGAVVLTVAGAKWKPNQWAGMSVWNTTGNSRGKVTANTENTVTAKLESWLTVTDSGKCTGVAGMGASTAEILQCEGKDWKDLTGQWVKNVTDGSKGKITKNTKNTLTTTLEGGKTNTVKAGDEFVITSTEPPTVERFTWKKGDAFKITDGYPCFDQIGRGPGTEVVEGCTVQKHEPVYGWNNTFDGKPWDFAIYRSPGEKFMQEGRDYISGQKPGYKPYQYPHPLQRTGEN